MDDVEDAPQLPDDIALCAPIHVVGDVIDNDGYMALRAKVNADYATVCDRCLDPLEGTVSFPLDRIVTTGSAAIENLDEDDIIWVKEGGIDFDREVLETVTLELPVYHLCCDDCPGLCDTCGKKSAAAVPAEKKKKLIQEWKYFKNYLIKWINSSIMGCNNPF